MTQTAAQKIEDDLIEQDIRYRRVDASIRREVDRRLLQLGRDIKALMLDIDIAGTKRNDARRRRKKKFKEELRVLVNTAYSEIGGILRNATRRVAKVEAKKVAEVMVKRIP